MWAAVSSYTCPGNASNESFLRKPGYRHTDHSTDFIGHPLRRHRVTNNHSKYILHLHKFYKLRKSFLLAFSHKHIFNFTGRQPMVCEHNSKISLWKFNDNCLLMITCWQLRQKIKLTHRYCTARMEKKHRMMHLWKRKIKTVFMFYFKTDQQS